MVQELFDIWNNLAISVAKFASSMSWKKNNIVKQAIYSYNFYQLIKTHNLIISDQNIW